MSESPTRLVVGGSGSALVFSGEIDAHTAPEFREALDGTSAADAVSIDMSDVSFMDSSGLRALLEAHARFDAAAGSLTIVSPSRAVRRLFEISGLDGHLTITGGD